MNKRTVAYLSKKYSIETLQAAIFEALPAYAAKTVFDSPEKAKEIFQGRLKGRKNESFFVAYLDNRHNLIAIEEEFKGSVASSSVHPRVIAQRALELNACAVVLAHNHPSGNPDPSTADITITRTIKDALQVFEVRVIDHVIVGDYTISMAEQHLL